ncbi:hypothetical protein LSH36_5g13018 [Paralvinella palmiformis]|uniref:G-protein coupled receptors family 1 profile domain-containing protein n=1 Tax=Paralvinella palmiformis TaxID=53620 RepID=A0AAD9KF33_9ANNE|nr:hypothetical protein LSH36_5g13018 [Paralvinella palmiformis]
MAKTATYERLKSSPQFIIIITIAIITTTMQSENMVLLTASPDLDQLPDRTRPHHFLIPNDVDDDDVASGVTESWTNVSNSSASPTSPWATRDERLAKIEIAIQAVIFILAVLGNGFVLLALRYRKRKTSRMHVFIMHLSVADLLVAMLNILPQLAWDVTFRFRGGDALCRLVKYLQVMVIYLSTYVLVMTAVDRYRAICHPLSTRSWTSRKSHLMIGLAWIISLVLSAPQLVIFRMQRVGPDTEVTDCWADFTPEWTLRLYITAFSITVFFLPSLILGLLYGRICYVVWRNVYHRTVDDPERFTTTTRQRTVVSWPENGLVRYKFTRSLHAATGPFHHRGEGDVGAGLVRGRSHCVSGISRAKIKTIKLTIVVIIAYLVCWAPFIITQLWWAYDDTAPYNNQRTPKRSPTPNTNQPPTTVLRCREAADNYGQRGDVRATKLEYLINAPTVVDAQPHRPLAAVGGPTVALRWRGTIQTTSTTRRVGIYYI